MVDIKHEINAIKQGEKTFADVTSNVAFWPNVFEFSDLCHVYQNALQESLVAEPDWKEFELGFKSCCKVLGEPSYKEIVLNKCYVGAPAMDRRAVHQFNAEHVDWRWEYVENAS